MDSLNRGTNKWRAARSAEARRGWSNNERLAPRHPQEQVLLYDGPVCSPVRSLAGLDCMAPSSLPIFGPTLYFSDLVLGSLKCLPFKLLTYRFFLVNFICFLVFFVCVCLCVSPAPPPLPHLLYSDCVHLCILLSTAKVLFGCRVGEAAQDERACFVLFRPRRMEDFKWSWKLFAIILNQGFVSLGSAFEICVFVCVSSVILSN